MVFLEWFYLLLVANALVSDPAAHLNTGIHQERGDCGVRAADLSGHMRQVYLCEKSHSQVNMIHSVRGTTFLCQDWSLDCDDLCSENMFGDCSYQSSTWYTVCGGLWSYFTGHYHFERISGKPHANHELFAAVIFGLGAIGSLMYSYAFKDREPKRKEKLK